MRAALTPTLVRPGRRPGRRGLPGPDGLERRRRARAGRVLRGAPADAEGARDRAARRPPARARGLPAADRAGARRARPRRAASARASPRRPRSSPRSTARTSSSAARGSRPPTTASRRRRCSTPSSSRRVSPDELELLRIQAGTPAWGKEIDDRVLPAEAGLTERAVSFTKGCYPGQEPIARLHYRGHANRGLRVLALDGRFPRPRPSSSTRARASAGSRAPRRRDGAVALAYVRREVPEDAELDVGRSQATQLH